MPRKLTGLLFIIFSLAFSVSCGQPETPAEDVVAVKKLMAARKEAIEAGDLEKYKQLFLSDYYDGANRLDGLIQDMQRVMGKHKHLQFTYQKGSIDFRRSSARMVGNVSYSSEQLDKPVYHHETTMFRKVDGKWYISGGVATGLF